MPAVADEPLAPEVAADGADGEAAAGEDEEEDEEQVMTPLRELALQVDGLDGDLEALRNTRAAVGDEVSELRAAGSDEGEREPPAPAAVAERVYRVVCPPGVSAGEMIEVQVDGTAVQVEAPAGIQPGEEFEIVLGPADAAAPGADAPPAEASEEDRRVEVTNAAAEQAAVTKLRKEKKDAQAAARRRPPPSKSGIPHPRGTPQRPPSGGKTTFADRQAQASAEKKLRLDAKRRLQMQTVTGTPPTAAEKSTSVSAATFAERQAVLNAERAARLAQKQQAKLAATAVSATDSPKVNLREFTARQDMHLEEQRERRKALQKRREEEVSEMDPIQSKIDHK